MAARRNAILVRYKVFIEDDDTASGGSGGGGVIPVDDIISVSGLTLGEEGTVTVPEWDRDTEISNGKRKLSPLGLKYKLKGNNLPTFKFFTNWWENRNSQIKKIRVEICDRAWKVLYTLVFTGVEISGHKMEDQDLGTPKLGIWEVTTRPYDVFMTDADGNIIVSEGGIG